VTFSAPDANSLVVADSNKDGKPDIAFASSMGRIGILLGNGDGTFTAAASTDVAETPLLVVGDFDGDGNPDLAVAAGSQGNGDVRVLWGKGDGTFSAAVLATIPFIAGPWSLVTGDFNNDGIDDLSVLTDSSEWVHLDTYIGNSTRSLAARESALLGVSLFLLPGDFDADGNLDLASAGGIVLGNGDGTFRAPGNASLNYLPGGSSAAIGGFNSDGRPDLIFLGDVTTLAQAVPPVDLTIAVNGREAFTRASPPPLTR
jgi:hypothetical protein